MDNQKAVEILMDIQSDWECGEEYDAFTLATQALEKQAFFKNEVAEIRDWFVDNKDMMLDSAYNVASMGFDTLSSNYDLIDKVDLDMIVEDIVNELQKGILNVLSTSEKEPLEIKSDKWIPVSERLPEYNKSVLLYLNNDEKEKQVVGYLFFSESDNFEKCNNYFCVDEVDGLPSFLTTEYVKAWRELPELYKGALNE